MSTLADRSASDACAERLAHLTPASPRQWGRMTPHQMVCHLNDSFIGVVGERPISDISNFFSRSVMRWVALHTPLTWPHGVKTLPEVDQEKGGTPPADWVRDRDQLRQWIESFADRKTFSPHPIFGALSYDEWMIWGYRHVDHHFRQFGL